MIRLLRYGYDMLPYMNDDGYVMVDRQEQGGSKTILRASPANGKFKFGNSLIQVKVPVMYLGWCHLSLSLPPGNWQPGRGRPLLREVRLKEASLHRPLQPLHGQEPVPQRRLWRGGKTQNLLTGFTTLKIVVFKYISYMVNGILLCPYWLKESLLSLKWNKSLKSTYLLLL